MKSYSFETSKKILAPVASVYALWTSEKKKDWTSPADCITTKFESDFRVGGDYRQTMKTPGGLMKNKGTYHEILPNKKIVMSFIWDVKDTEVNMLTIHFKAKGKHAEISILGTGFSSEEEAIGNCEGWASCLHVFAEKF